MRKGSKKLHPLNQIMLPEVSKTGMNIKLLSKMKRNLRRMTIDENAESVKKNQPLTEKQIHTNL